MQEATPPPIQRLLILHLNLALLCTGKVLSESASTEEWQEHILYYYQETSTANSSDPEIHNNHAAIQFASLCIALVNLPTVLSSTDDKDDQLCEVQLDKSTLVFIPLESEMHNNTAQIVAVAQFQKSGTGNCNPLAIRASVERWHQLFCLLRYGGIHYRLSRLLSKPPIFAARPSADEHECPYPGMDQLFDRLKALRRLRETMYRSNNSDFNQQEEETQLVAEIKGLRSTLPIASLGKDLTFHYDAYLGDLANASERHSGAGRCVVETIPAPIARAADDHNLLSEWAPGCPLPHVSFHLGRAISMLLSTSTPNTMDNNSQLLAVSTFYQGQLLYHHQGGDGHFFEEQNSSASLLMWYFASYSTKIRQQKQNQQTFATSSPPSRISRGLVSFSDHVSVTSGVEAVDYHGDPFETAQDHSQGNFLPTPPLAMLSASEQNTTSVRGPSNELVWAPLVCCNSGDEGGLELVHGIVYEWNDFSFLLYIRPTEETAVSVKPDISAHEEFGEEGIETLLENISTSLHDCLSLHADPVSTKTNGVDSSAMPESQRMMLSASGRDLIFVDRKSQVMWLFPRLAPKQPKRSSSRSPRKFMNAFRPAIPDIQEENKSANNHDLMNWALEGLDCRHWLASRLSPEALSAFDDVMNEVNSQKQTSRTRKTTHRPCDGIGDDGIYEVLTTIREGWMYALADEQDQEIYILFDSKEYATIRDVQNAIANVRGLLSYGMARS